LHKAEYKFVLSKIKISLNSSFNDFPLLLFTNKKNTTLQNKWTYNFLGGELDSKYFNSNLSPNHYDGNYSDLLLQVIG